MDHEKRCGKTNGERPKVYKHRLNCAERFNIADVMTKKVGFEVQKLANDHDWAYAPKKGKKVKMSTGVLMPRDDCVDINQSWDVCNDRIGVCMVCGRHGPAGMKCWAEYVFETPEMIRDRNENWAIEGKSDKWRRWI